MNKSQRKMLAERIRRVAMEIDDTTKGSAQRFNELALIANELYDPLKEYF